MIDQPPEQRMASDYADYTASAGGERLDELGAVPRTSRSPRGDREPAPSVADALTRDAVALSQLLVALLPIEQALGQALLIGLRLLPSARHLGVYVAISADAGAEPDVADAWLRLATVERVIERVVGDETGTLDLTPRQTRTLGLGGEVDRRARLERAPVWAPDGACVPLFAVGPDGGAGRACGALVVRWQAEAPRETPELALLAPCCATLLARRAQVEAERRIAASLALLHALQRHVPAARAPSQDALTSLSTILEELDVLRVTADTLRPLLGAVGSAILVPSHDGALRVHAGSETHEGQARGDMDDSFLDAALATPLIAALSASDSATIPGVSPLAAPLRALLRASSNPASPPPLSDERILLLAARVARRLAALLAFDAPAASEGSAQVSMALAEVAVAGATLHALRLGRAAVAEDQARDDFLSLTVHELRSPLTAVKGYAQLLLRQSRRLSVPEQMSQAIAAIEEQGTRMADMISEMHDAVRIRRGDLELDAETVELAPLVAHAVEQQRKLFPQHTMALDLPDEALVGEWDPRRVEQVVAALVNNAARYTPSGGLVEIAVARRETTDGQPAALLCVRDRGVGVAEPDRARIFEYLYRSPETKRRRLSGLGLGLFVSRTLAERMGGRLWLEETSTGDSGDPSGSAFCLLLPLDPQG